MILLLLTCYSRVSPRPFFFGDIRLTATVNSFHPPQPATTIIKVQPATLINEDEKEEKTIAETEEEKEEEEGVKKKAERETENEAENEVEKKAKIKAKGRKQRRN